MTTEAAGTVPAALLFDWKQLNDVSRTAPALALQSHPRSPDRRDPDQALDRQCHSVPGAGRHRGRLRHGHPRLLQADVAGRIDPPARRVLDRRHRPDGRHAGRRHRSVGRLDLRARHLRRRLQPSSSSSSRSGWRSLAAVATGLRLRRHQRLSDRLHAAARLPDHAGDLDHRPRALRHSGRELRRAGPDLRRHVRHLGLHRRRHAFSASRSA